MWSQRSDPKGSLLIHRLIHLGFIIRVIPQRRCLLFIDRGTLNRDRDTLNRERDAHCNTAAQDDEAAASDGAMAAAANVRAVRRGRSASMFGCSRCRCV